MEEGLDHIQNGISSQNIEGAASKQSPVEQEENQNISFDNNEADFPDSSYECAICTNWLNEPVLTTCGHRFCKACLSDWMQNHRQNCPSCQQLLTPDKDVFPDNFTRREINQKKLKCPNSSNGCSVIGSPFELDQHKQDCPFQRKHHCEPTKCPYGYIKCNFVARSGYTLEDHLKSDTALHLELMLKAVQQKDLATWNPQKPTESYMLSSHSQYGNGADEQLIQDLCQRIVILEQRDCEKDAKIENLTKQLSLARVQVDPRYSNGTIVWEMNGFQSLVEQLRANSNNLVYSHECYTSPYGYKFCARINIQPKRANILSLHVHLMQSENDFHLDWPFKGRIKLCMVHPLDANLSQIDTIMTKPEILAFYQPREHISTRGFGFVEYANIIDIQNRGFCHNDRLVIKIQINIV